MMLVRMLFPNCGSIAWKHGILIRQTYMALAIMFVSIDVFAAERPDSFADQVEKLSPAVVNISTTAIVNDGQAMEMPQFPPGSPFEEFFKNFGENISE